MLSLLLKMNMKCRNVFAIFLCFQDSFSRNVPDPESSRRDLEEKEAIRAKTSLIVFNKQQMSLEEIDSETNRILGKCVDLQCPCTTTRLTAIGVLQITWTCDNHPSVLALGLNESKEVGAEDILVKISDAPSVTDPMVSKQWALQDLLNNADINIREGWEEYLSDKMGGDDNGPSIIVAVIDTGIEYVHDEFSNNPGRLPILWEIS